MLFIWWGEAQHLVNFFITSYSIFCDKFFFNIYQLLAFSATQILFRLRDIDIADSTVSILMLLYMNTTYNICSCFWDTRYQIWEINYTYYPVLMS